MNSDDSRTWQRVQVWSGLAFSAFLFIHLVNQALAALGEATYDAAQGQLRRAYQTPVVELAAVLLPMLVHMVAAGVVLLRRRGVPAPTAVRSRLHRYTGRFLLVFALGHTAATRLPSLLAGVFPGFLGVAYTFQWVPAWFWPYYPALALAGWIHLVGGLAQAGARFQWPALRWLNHRIAFPAVVSGGAAALLLGVLALGGVLADTSRAGSSEYARLVQRLTTTPGPAAGATAETRAVGASR